MDHALRRRSTWKFTGTFCAVLVGLALLGWIWASRAADRRIAALDKKIAARVSEIEARDTRRPVLQGPGESGHAWDDYLLALEDLRPLDQERLSALITRNWKTDLEWGRRMMEEHQAAFDYLRRGARRESSGRIYDWKNGGRPTFTSHAGGCLKLYYLTVARARELLQHGNAVGAVDLYLDLCQFGRDVSTEGYLGSTGMGMIYLALSDLQQALRARTLTREALLNLAAGLPKLAQGFPDQAQERRRYILQSVLESRRELDESSVAERLTYLEYNEMPWDWAERLAKAEETSWSEVCTVRTQIDEEARRGWTSTYRSGAPLHVTLPPLNRSILCYLRMLLVAVLWRLDEPIPDLEDPYGAQLKHTANGTVLRIWSIGRNGVDDGGVGIWSDGSKDIVLEVER